MSGPHFTESGDVVSSALAASIGDSAHEERSQNFRIELGQIEQVYTIDDPKNTSRNDARFTVYDVNIMKPNGAMEVIPRCRALQPLFGGGFNNFLEVLPTDPGSKAKDPKTDISLKRGHYVLVAFISGRKDTGVILGAMPHASKVAIGRRPKKIKGVYTEGEIQGLNFSVDNDGALKVVFNGPRKDDGSLLNKNGPTTIEISKDGIINVSTNAKQKITIDRMAKKIRVENGATYIDSDASGDKIQVVAKTVEIGTGALQPAVVGDDWKAIMEELITEIMAIIVPTGVGPSGNPTNNGKFSAIKSKLKEALSKNHKVEK